MLLGIVFIQVVQSLEERLPTHHNLRSRFFALYSNFVKISFACDFYLPVVASSEREVLGRLEDSLGGKHSIFPGMNKKGFYKVKGFFCKLLHPTSSTTGTGG